MSIKLIISLHPKKETSGHEKLIAEGHLSISKSSSSNFDTFNWCSRVSKATLLFSVCLVNYENLLHTFALTAIIENPFFDEFQKIFISSSSFQSFMNMHFHWLSQYNF